MRSLVLLVLLFVAGCRCEEGQIQQVKECGRPCFVGNQAQAGVGICHMGSWYCGDGEEPTCMDQGYPLYLDGEMCNGQDDDCDGKVDEGVRVQACSNGCGSGTEACVDGAWAGCSAPTPQPEICNGKDDDCDGRFDEDIDDSIVFCYDRDPNETRYGSCRPGVKRCILGVETCHGQILPSPETCDGLDNNCNGLVDDGINNTDPVDIVFVIDNSCSMVASIAAVKLATTSFANTYAGHDIRWALVVAPDPDNSIEGVHLYQDFTDASTFATAMQAMNGNGSGYEPTLDAMEDITAVANPLHLSWSLGSRHVMVVFTDEEPQSYRNPLNTAMSVSMSIENSETRTFVFTIPQWAFTWQWALPAAWGNLRYLSSVAQVMEMELKTVVQEVSCR